MRRSLSRSTLLKKKRSGVVSKPAASVARRGGRTVITSTIYQSLRIATGNPKVCIVRSLGGIGDVLMCTPLLRQLKNEFPNIELTFAIDRTSTKPEDVYYQLVKNASFIDKIIEARHVDKKKYDLWADITTVCIRHENKNLPVTNRIDIFSRSVGIPKLVDPVPFYEVLPEEKTWARSFLDAHHRQKKLVIHTASFDSKRSWSSDHNQELITLLAARRPDIHIYLFDFNNVVDTKLQQANITDCSHLQIRQKAALIEQADLFLGPDSGPMHLAGALHKRALVIFGNIPPKARINYYGSHRAITAPTKLPCQFCWYQRCNINLKCMTDIIPEQVFSEITNVLR